MPSDSARPISDPNLTDTQPEMGESERKWDIGDLPNLTSLQVRAIELIIQGHSDVQTARILSIDRRTLWHWRTFDEDYSQALAAARMQIHDAVTDRYQNIIFKATSVLTKLLEDPADNNRIRSAQILLNIASRYKPKPLTQHQTASPSDGDDWPELPELPPKVC